MPAPERHTRAARRRLLGPLAVGVLLLAPLAGCRAPPPAEKPKVVILTPQPFPILDDSIAGIRKGLAAEGLGPDKLDLREVNAGGQSTVLAGYAREIVAAKPTVILPVSTPATEVVLGAAPATQDIVFSTVTDPAKAKVPATSPNITGVSDVVNFKANVDLLQELFPKAKRVGTIYNPGDTAAVFGLEQLKPILAARGLSLVIAPATNSNEAVSAARSLVGRVDVILIGSDGNAATAMPGIVAVTNPAKLPVLTGDAGSVRDGALAAVSVDYEQLGRAVAKLVAQVIRDKKGAGQHPRIAFVGDKLIVNTVTAAALGYSFPPEVLSRKPQVVGAK